MIDPTKITNFERTLPELEEFLMFAICVAGKNSFQQAAKLDLLLTALRDHTEIPDFRPFKAIHQMEDENCLIECLREVKMGQYNRISTAFRGISFYLSGGGINFLSWIELKYLECIKGIGMKTARFFVMHSRPNQMVACLDTHILKWLAAKGHEVPKSTPQGDKYLALEKIFLDYAKEMSMMPADLDLKIWNESHC